MIHLKQTFTNPVQNKHSNECYGKVELVARTRDGDVLG